MTAATSEPAAPPPAALTDLALPDWDALALLPAAPRWAPKSVRAWTLRRGARSVEDMSDMPKGLRREIAARWRVRLGQLETVHESADGTLGLITRLWDGQLIESVAIPDEGRHTLCLSSQVGCAVACRFCASGIGGVVRNLSPGEIIEQVLVAREARPDDPITNYVFMGSGEPTHNLANVIAAIRVMTDPEGLAIGARRITVSTVGNPQAVGKLAEIDIPFNLALSVHMPSDAGRLRLMPGLGKSDLARTLAAALGRFDRTGRRITVEVVLIAGLNDRDEDARAFAQLLSGLPILVNLIPWNAVDGIDLHTPSEDRVERVKGLLKRAGLAVTVRRPRGQDVGVACGQLRRRAEAQAGQRPPR